ncbi:hypothetical protein PV341_32835 [Streptomyces sp. PA03-1a]|nr:hypothetical protein [Streptomyces sp. PA03-1a]
MTVLPTRSAASAVNETVPPALGWATSTRPSRTAVFSQWAPSTVTGTRTSARALPVLSRDSAGVKRTTEVGISVIPSAYAEENLQDAVMLVETSATAPRVREAVSRWSARSLSAT